MLYRYGALSMFLAACTDFLISYLFCILLKIQDGKFAMGFSGDIEGGGKTAYDVLPPKPWKAAP